MKYYYCISEMMTIDLDNVTSFITERIEKNGIEITKLSFDDSNFSEFLEKSEIGKHFTEKDSCIIVLGEDEYLYRLSLGGLEQIENSKGTITLEKYIKSTYKFTNLLIKSENYRQRIFKKYNADKIHKTGNGFAKYNKYIYIAQTSNTVIPCRFRKAHKENQPLIIYFGGAGTIGHDNFKQFFEHFTLGKTLQLLRADCNILVPQFVRDNSTNESYVREIYTEAVFDLIKELQSEIDSSRIYIYGCSFGGGIVWNMLVNHSDMIAGAIELMGEYHGFKSIDEIDFKSIAKVPIWMAHSTDDRVVSIDSDDKFYQKLKEQNANVKYTRPNKHGHKLAGAFLQKQNWIEWLLNQQS
ncbi:dienelactone hydrolase family protein [uncultured Eubacterium sp.]|uniref:carboxylesterase family protein n=1 Tax=uncultured Eubacterium sp. TaxID=165185 RepID=UPI00260DE8C2|nr:dienelactone hydrolase family protein [uncultured Eubacterium sp.]